MDLLRVLLRKCWRTKTVLRPLTVDTAADDQRDDLCSDGSVEYPDELANDAAENSATDDDIPF